MSSSTKTDNRKKDIIILGKGPIQELNINCLQKTCIQLILLKMIKKLFSSFHYNGSNSYLLIVQKFINLKQKILKL